MSESTQNEGKTVLQLDEKTMDELRSGGYLLVAFDGGNAKLKLANLENIVVFNFNETVGTDTAASIYNAIQEGKSVFCRLDDGSLLTLRETFLRPIRHTFGDGVNAVSIVGNEWFKSDDKIPNVVMKTKLLSDDDIDEGVIYVDGHNCSNRLTLRNNESSLIIRCKPSSDAYNCVVEIDNTGNANNVDIGVQGQVGNSLRHSSSSSTTIQAGKFAQVTVVGTCWSLAEFDA